MKRTKLFSESNNLSCYKKPAYDLSANKHQMNNFDILSTGSKRATSELNYNLHQKYRGKSKFLLLDQDHMEKLKDKENMHERSLYEPEGYNSDYKLEY